jgi:hypothetical protein
MTMYAGNEVDDLFDVAQRPDPSCRGVLLWWKITGLNRFPNIALLAREVLMAMGSSVPSEDSFSDSSQVGRPDRGSLSDAQIETMMKLRSWNRFLGVVPASWSIPGEQSQINEATNAIHHYSNSS